MFVVNLFCLPANYYYGFLPATILKSQIHLPDEQQCEIQQRIILNKIYGSMKGKQTFSCWDSCLKVLAKQLSSEDKVGFCQNGSLSTSQNQHTFHHVKVHLVENSSVTLHCLQVSESGTGGGECDRARSRGQIKAENSVL